MLASSLAHTARRVAVVTGAAAGIGRAIATRLAADGLCVVVNDLPTQSKPLATLVSDVKSAGGVALPFEADITLDQNVQKMVDFAVERFGSLDVMVANAGGGKAKPILDLSLEEVDKYLRLNAHSTFLAYKYAAKQMIEQGRGGRIIGASSIAGKKGYPSLAAYGPGKTVVRSLTQTAAGEFGRFGITVNAYCPGFVNDTPLADGFLNTMAILNSLKSDVMREAFVQQSALGGFAEVRDVAGLVSFLASKDSAFITGQSITVDGGMIFD